MTNQANNQPVYIGIDHGYGNMKTRNFVFKTGIAEYIRENFTTNYCLHYKGKYYYGDNESEGIVVDKTENENYFLLTLMAVAKELKFRGYPAGHKIDVVLGCGLPITQFSNNRDSFSNYLSKPSIQPIHFEFERDKYVINIIKVLMFPQGYSAIYDKLKDIKDKEPVIHLVDIGAWTVDYMQIDNGQPDMNKCRSIEYGVISLKNAIEERVLQLNLSVEDAQIDYILSGKECTMDDTVKKIIKEEAHIYADTVLRELSKKKVKLTNVPVIFIGGGSEIMRRYADKSKIAKAEFITDVRANAIGYEEFAKALYKS